ncbi:hypothetical protein OROMI_007557 [Orobanche minor]
MDLFQTASDREMIERFLRPSPDERQKETLEYLLGRLLESAKFVKDNLFSMSFREQLNGILSVVGRMSPEDVKSSTFLTKLRNVAASQEILKKHDSKWHRSICYPVPRESIFGLLDVETDLFTLYRELLSPVLSGRGIHLFDDDDVASSNVIPDVVSLLSLGETLVGQTSEMDVVVKPDIFAEKHVLVFCMNAPVMFGSDGCQSIFNLCKELESRKIGMVMVMVARMNILADEKGAFDHLFSGFPRGSLAVPYEDWERRERVWKLLNGSSYGVRCSVYNTDGIFLTSFCVDDITPYGADAFPFDKVKERDEEWKRLRYAGGLEELLRPCESSEEVVVHELNGSEEKKRISEVIKDKHVGLYVCCTIDTRLAPLVQKLYDQQCRIKGEEFEIVVLFLPLLTQMDPQVFQEIVESSLQERNIRGWWCLPFNNSVSLRFWGLTKGCDCGFYDHDWREDRLIIAGPGGKILDMYGAQLIQRSDGFDAFPFTRQAIVDKKKLQLKRLILNSWSLEGGLVRGNDPNDVIFANDLLGKKRIVVCFGMPHYYDYLGLVSRYENADRSKFEVVFIQFPGAEVEEESEGVEEESEGEGEGDGEGEVSIAKRPYPEIPWYIHCPLDASLAKEFKKLVRVESLVGFGEDGLICSVKQLAELVGPEVGENGSIWSLKQLDEASMGHLWNWDLCLKDTLDEDIHHFFHFDGYAKI